MVACLLPSANLSVDARIDQPARNPGTQQNMIDTQTGVSGKRIPKVIPKGVEALARMNRPQSIDPALLDRDQHDAPAFEP